MLKILDIDPPRLKVEFNGKTESGYFFVSPSSIDLHLSFGTFRLENPLRRSIRSVSAHPEGGLSAPMPGKVIKVMTRPGAAVKKGEILLVLEAMKMEHKILSPMDGTVLKILYKEGDRVSQGEDLVELKS